MGCIMVRQCHSNTCPVGVCTQDPTLRAKFAGTPEKVINLFSFIAEEVREILASARPALARRGRSAAPTCCARSAAAPRDLDDLDLNPLLVQVDPARDAGHCTVEGRNEVPDTLDAQMVTRRRAAVRGRREDAARIHRPEHPPRGRHAALGARSRASYGMDGLQPGHLTVRLRGSAGQSLGAFAVQGLKLEVFGDANDYVGKGLSGGTIVVRPPLSLAAGLRATTRSSATPCLYGATAGQLFAAGRAGERFAVRNSGADDRGRGLRRQRLRVHDRRHRGDPRPGRRQLRAPA